MCIKDANCPQLPPIIRIAQYAKLHLQQPKGAMAQSDNLNIASLQRSLSLFNSAQLLSLSSPLAIVLYSRVGDRPTATILQVQFYFFSFLLWFLKQNIRPKYAPPRRTNYTLKWRGGEAAPPIYFIFTPSRRGIFWLNILH